MKRNPAYYLAAAISLLTFAVYLSSLQNEFVTWDDGLYVIDNPFIHSLNGALLKWAFSDFYASNWHPLTWISHALDYAVWGLNPMGHHLTNNILHAVNTFLVVLLVVRLLASRQADKLESWQAGKLTSSHDAHFTLIAAATTGLLFGIHPIHVESVAWVAERKDLLCALFFLLSIMMYIRYITPPSPSYPKRGWRSRGSYFLSLAFFSLALLSKPMAVSLPFVLLLLDWYPFGRITSYKTFGTAFIGKMPFIALSLVSSILTVQAQKEAIVPIELVPLSQRILVGVGSLTGYLWKMILPVNLSPFYPYPENPSPFLLEFIVALVLVTGLTAACLIIAKKQRLWLSAWGYYTITLIPVLGVVQVGSQSMADRYTYLPGLAPFLIMGLLIAWISQRVILNRPSQGLKIFSIAAAISVPLCLSYLTVKQIGVWKDSITLWNFVIEKAPDRVPFAYYNRGLVFAKMGQYRKSIEEFDRAISLHPFGYSEFYNNRGVSYMNESLFDKTIEDLQIAIALDPNNKSAYYNLGLAYYRRGSTFLVASKKELAIADFQRACNIGNKKGCNVLQALGS